MDWIKLRECYVEAKKTFDIALQGRCILDAAQARPRTAQEREAYSFLCGQSYSLMYVLSDALLRRDLFLAERIFTVWGDRVFGIYDFLRFFRAVTFYEEQEWIAARQEFLRYLDLYPDDEIAWFYLGNVYAREGALDEASVVYEKVIAMRGSFLEAGINLSLIYKKMRRRKEAADLCRNPRIRAGVLRMKPQRYPWKSLLAIDCEDDAACRGLPIFINSRDRLGCLREQVAWLLEAGYTRLYILDNASTYAPLLAYYRELMRDVRVQVIFLGENMGYKAIWLSGILEKLAIETPYVYTDSDVVPQSDCPKNVVQILLRVLKRNPFLKKAGLGLIYQDITFYDREKWQRSEAGFYRFPIGENLYFAPVDTTFALYVNCRHYTLRMAARTTGSCMARHLPWYYDYDHLPEDEAYYMQHADSSSTIASGLLKKGETRWEEC